MMFLENTNIVLECDFAKLLSFLNSSDGISYARKINNNISSRMFPLNKSFLQNYYLTHEYGNFKATAKDVNCAADVVSFFLVSYGKANSNGTANNASGANSSGLNPFGLFNADLGFNLGGVAGWFWFLLLAFGVYQLTKD